MRRRTVLASFGLSGCMALDLGGDAPARLQYAQHDPGLGAVATRAAPIVDALLIQPRPSGAIGESTAIAFARDANAFASYQLASWTEAPTRAVPRLLQQRLQQRRVAAAVGIMGDPMRADWMLAVGVESLHHDLRASPGAGRVVLAVELFDRRRRVRVSARRVETSTAAARAEAAAAVQAIAEALAAAFDEIQAWLEVELQRAAGAAAAVQ